MIGKGWKLAALFLLIFIMGFVVWEMRDFGYPGGEPDLDDNGDQRGDITSSDGHSWLHDNNGTIPVYNQATGKIVYADRTFMDGQIFQESLDENGTTHASNVVTGVVFDFRGFDTLGEATVLFAAVSGVMLALRTTLPKKKGGEKE